MPLLLLSRLKQYLSSPWASVVCFLVAVIAKAGLIRVFLNIGPDKFAQVLITRNFLQGHGFTIDQAAINDLGNKTYVYFNGWPPGYNLLISPFLAMTDDNFMLACYLVDCITILLFFWYCRKTLLLIRFPVWTTNLFLLVQGFFINNYVESSTPTDFLSLALLVAALYYMLRVVEQTAFSGTTIFLLTFFLMAASVTRYQNIPVALLMAAALSVTGFFQKRKSHLWSGFVAFAVVAVVCGGFLVWQYFHTGNGFYVVPVKKGWFPENLALTHAFIIDSFVNLRLYTVQLASLFPVKYSLWEQLIRWAGLLVLILFLAWGSSYLFKKKAAVSSARDGFFVFGFIISMAVILLLAFLSVTHDSNIGAPMFVWTYVSPGRYFSFPSFFVQVCAWWFLFVKAHRSDSLLLKGLKALFILLAFIEVAHGAYIMAKKFSRTVPPLREIVFREEEVALTIHFIEELRQKDPARKVVATGFAKKYGFIAGWYGGAGMFTPLALNQALPHSNTPAVLLVVVNKKELFLLGPFLQQPGVRLFRETKDFRLYTYYVEPASRNNP